MAKKYSEFMADYLKKSGLIGARITNPIIDSDSDDEEGMWGFKAIKDTPQGRWTYNVWVLRDPEGNGPGHLDIDKFPPDAKRPKYGDGEKGLQEPVKEGGKP